MASTRTFDIVIGKVYNNGILCPCPIVEYAGKTGAALPCKDEAKGIYTVEVLEGDLKDVCLTFIIRCADCDNCAPIVKEVCLCDSKTDCGPCEICECNVCVSTCETGQQCCEISEGTFICCDCDEDNPCPCNQVCIGGRCVCPPGTVLNPLTGCCDNCSNDSDCDVCSICEQGTCIPKPCPGCCDSEGQFGSPGACVECCSASDCDGSNECCEGGSCVCCPGFVRVGGICIEEPDCTSDADCTIIDPCLRCELGVCVRQQCAGKIAVNVDGECKCLERCDCDEGDCSKVTDYCDAVTAQDCACFPCKGTCASGCEDPCYCSPSLQKCINNPCKDIPCTTGVDCPEGCGCYNGTCTPCDLLSCLTTECTKALGCECFNNKCVPDRCVGDCDTSFDCAVGCTCVNGQCVSCGNFTCSPISNCTSHEGCVCVNGNCEGGDKTCSDSLNIIKDDDNCSITGELVMENCCSCSPLTLDIKGQRAGEDANFYSLIFKAEARKGSYNGFSPDTNPLLDDFANDNIADNEPPTSGVITMMASIVYSIYVLNPVTGRYEFQGSSTTQGETKTASFPSSGTTATLLFPATQLPKIGVRQQVDATTQREATSVRVRFFQSSNMNFPNKCVYQGGVTIGDYNINQNNQWLNFVTGSGFSNPIGTTITSSVCRDPFFRWFKDGTAVRKSYIPGGPIYTDVITRPPYEWLESCHEYSLKVDCSCDTDANRYIVFCNPEELDYTVDPNSCNSCITIDSFDTCTPNEDLEFFVEFGDQKITWIGDAAPIGQKFCSTTPFQEIKYGLSCDTEEQCVKTYELDGDGELEIDDPTTVCNEDLSEFTVTFPNKDKTGGCLVDYIEINGFTLSTNLSIKLPIGTYTATVYWKCGCPPIEVTVQEDCCSANVGLIERYCGGDIICQPADGVEYSIVNSNGTLTQLVDVCATLNTLSNTDALVIRAQRGGCDPVNIVLPSLTSNCCDSFRVQVNQITATFSDIIVVGGTDYVLSAENLTTGDTVDSLGHTSGGPLTLSQNGPGRWTLSGYVENNQIKVTANDVACNDEDVTFQAGGCNLSVFITEYSEDNACRLKAEVDPSICPCNQGLWHVDINVSGITMDDTTVTIPFTAHLMGYEDIGVTSGSVWAGRDDVGPVNQVTVTGASSVEGTGSVTVMKNFAVTPNTMTVNVTASLTGQPSDILLDLNVYVKDGTTDLISLSNIDTVKVYNELDGTQLIENPTGFYFQLDAAAANSTIPIRVEATDTDGALYIGKVFIQLAFGQTKIATAVLQESIDLGTAYIPVKFEIRDFGLEDNCTYQDAVVNFLVSPAGTVLPEFTQSVGLVADNPNAKRVKFTWSLDGEELWDEFVGAPTNFTSYLPLGYTIVGATYDVFAECLPCTDDDQKQLCCLPTLIGYDILGCNEYVDLTFQGNPGDYYITYEGVQWNFTIPPAGTVTLTNVTGAVAGTMVDSGGTVHVGSICVDTWAITLVTPCSPSFETECDGPGTYSIVVGGCGSIATGSSLSILSGTGSVSGLRIDGADPLDPPEVEITDSNGCTFNAGFVNPDPGLSCIAPSSSNAPSSSSPTPSSSNIPASSGASSSVPASSSNAPAADPSSSVQAASSGAPPPCTSTTTISGGTMTVGCVGATVKLNLADIIVSYNTCCDVTSAMAAWSVRRPDNSIVASGNTIGTIGSDINFNLPSFVTLSCGSDPAGTYTLIADITLVANNCTYSNRHIERTRTVTDADFTMCGCSPASSNPPAASSPAGTSSNSPAASSSRLPSSSNAPASSQPAGASSSVRPSSSRAPSSSNAPASSSQPNTCSDGLGTFTYTIPAFQCRDECAPGYEIDLRFEEFINICCGTGGTSGVSGTWNVDVYVNGVNVPAFGNSGNLIISQVGAILSIKGGHILSASNCDVDTSSNWYAIATFQINTANCGTLNRTDQSNTVVLTQAFVDACCGCA